MERRSLLASIFIHAAALLLAVVILAPIFWLFVMSISPAGDLVAKPLGWWPSHVDFSRYAVLLSTVPNSAGAAFVASLFNSILVAGMATLAAIVLAIPAGWAVSRTPSVGWSLSLVIATYMLPPVALAVPLYMALAWLGLLNSVFGLALVYLSILAPFTTWLMKSGFDGIPREIEQAAMIDGAGLFTTLRILTLPLAMPIVATSALFAFLLGWDEFFYALLFTSDHRHRRPCRRAGLRLRADRDRRRARRAAAGAGRPPHAAGPHIGAHQRRRERIGRETACRHRKRQCRPDHGTRRAVAATGHRGHRRSR